MYQGGGCMNYNIQNPRLKLTVSTDGGIFIRECTCSPEKPAVYSKNGEVFLLKTEEREYTSGEFEILDAESCRDETEELLSITAVCRELNLTVNICFLNNLADAIAIILRMSDSSLPEKRKNYYLHSPFLSSLHLGDSAEERKYFPAAPLSGPNGESVMRLHPLIHLPLVLTDREDRYGLSVSFPSYSDLEVAVQNRNVEFWKISNEKDLKQHSVLLRLNESLADVAEFSVCGLTQGWREAFGRVRRDFCGSLDLREYERDDLAWFCNTFLHHFTFLYSKEVYDDQAGRVDLDKLADAGMEFGGYDTAILWHQYPRLGVDQRLQWDFFRDFPEGIRGIEAAVRAAHQRGIQILLPYKPWDISSSQSMDAVGEEMIGLLRETDADGFFLDTMEQVPGGFREAADAVRPGIVFCSELHPNTRESLEILTASWDQFWSIPCMPEIDLLRFILPGHTAPQISRWQNGSGKDMLIKRAIFSGTGLVVWQDVFGSWLPYSAEQKETIRRYKQLWLEYRSYFQGTESIPLYPTEWSGLYCNRFSAEAENADTAKGYVYTFYNSSEKEYQGTFIVHRETEPSCCKCLWGIREICLNGNKIEGRIAPKEVAVIFTA